ncbi:MAG TPA: POTRA domain-containing protein, partial [Gammaproteobacteria bacterium]
MATGTNLQTSQTPTPQLDKADPTVDIQLAAAHGGMKGKAEAPGVSAMRDRRRQLLEMLGAERVRHGKMPAAMRAEIQEHIDWLEGRVNNVTAQLRQQGVSDDMLAMDETMAMKAVGAEAVTVTVKGYTFEGNASIASEALDGLVSDTVGRTLTFSQLNEVVGRVTKHYRDNGFVVARAYLPAQEIANGSIKVGVLEGKPGFVAANTSESRLDVVFANKYLEPLRSAGSLKQAELERSLLLLNDLAGVEVSSTLKPGQKVGETDIDVAVSDTEHFTGSIDAQNYGGDNNGKYRLGGTFNINNLTGRGDQVQFRGFTSTEADTWLASVGYVTPIGSKGTKLGARYAYMRGDVGEEFAALGIESEAETFSLYGVHPIVRSRTYNVYGQVGYDYKDIREEW